MSLPLLWFLVVAVFWTGFFILDGYDFGVGALHRRIGRDKAGRHEVVETIGPYWDANEVWLVVAVAAVFAAFPDWYATWLSAGYLAFVLALALLLVRGTAIEYGSRGLGVAWDRAWGWGLVVSSLLIPFVLGLALGDLLAGLPLDDSGAFTGGIADIVTPFGVLLGVAMAVLCVVQGGAFLLLRTTGDVWARARRETSRVAVFAPLVVAAAAAWMFATDRIGLEARTVAIAAVAASVTAAFCVLRGRGGLAFVASTACRRGHRRVGVRRPLSRRRGLQLVGGQPLGERRRVRALRAPGHELGRTGAGADRARVPGLELRAAAPTSAGRGVLGGRRRGLRARWFRVRCV